jgi:hypothetical protein
MFCIFLRANPQEGEKEKNDDETTRAASGISVCLLKPGESGEPVRVPDFISVINICAARGIKNYDTRRG